MNLESATKGALAASVFSAGLITMALEIVAARIIAPYWGSSAEVWVALIGVILTCLTIGGWSGGYLADRVAKIRILANGFYAVCALILLIWAFSNTLLSFLSAHISDLRLGTLLSVLTLLGPVSIILGGITPYALRLSLRNLEQSGLIAGRVYALSSFGSIVGTFLAGYLLLPYIGHTKIILLLASIALITGAILTISRLLTTTLGILLVSAFLGSTNSHSRGIIVDLDSRYSRIQVSEAREAGTFRPVRLLRNGPCGIQGAKYLDAPEGLKSKFLEVERRFGGGSVFPQFVQGFDLAFHFLTNNKPRVLVLGGGALLFPMRLLEQIPEAIIDVIEIDPSMTLVAQEQFGAKLSDQLRVTHEDARIFLNHAVGSYDLILLDAFSASCGVPAHILTREATLHIKKLLSEHGIFLTNVISAADGNAGLILRSIKSTQESIFDAVKVFAVENQFDGRNRQNFVLVSASRGILDNLSSVDPSMQSKLSKLWPKVLEPGIILTDDYAPVERMLMRFD